MAISNPSVTVAPSGAKPDEFVKLLSDAQSVFAYLAKDYAALVPIINSLAGTRLVAPAVSSSESGSSSSTSVSAGINIGVTTDIGAVAGAAGALFTASGKIADAISAHEKILNSPEMQNASEVQKWQAFKDLVNKSEVSGDEQEQEKLQAD